jgi:Xaa-Pro aminopeptidase
MTPYPQRLDALRHRLQEQEIDLLILTPSPFMYWATGLREAPFFGMLKGPGDWASSVLLTADRGPLLLVQWMVHRMLVRLPTPFDTHLSEVRVVQHEDDADRMVRDAVESLGPAPRRIAVADRMHARYLTSLLASCPGAEIIMASSVMDDLVAIKEEFAIEQMRRLTTLTDAAYGEALKALRVGTTEAEMALEIDFQFRRHGAEGSSFPSSVVFGRPGDLPPTRGKQLQAGDSVMFDIGATLGGYCSDFGRSAFVGEPPPDYVALHELVLQAQQAGIRAMRPGETRCDEVVTAVQQVLIDGGVGANLIPQVGHAIGMTVHEAPLLIRGDQAVIQPGMTFTVEPTIRHASGYVNRVEDIVLVMADGVEYLSTYPRSLHIVS